MSKSAQAEKDPPKKAEVTLEHWTDGLNRLTVHLKDGTKIKLPQLEVMRCLDIDKWQTITPTLEMREYFLSKVDHKFAGECISKAWAKYDSWTDGVAKGKLERVVLVNPSRNVVTNSPLFGHLFVLVF